MNESEVRMSYACLGNPIVPFVWTNERIAAWAKTTGYQGAEYLPYRLAASQINKIGVLSSLPEIKSGHVAFNPYATVWSVLLQRKDPLRPGEKLNVYNLAFANPRASIESLHKLERHIKDFPVVTYPYERGEEKPYGEYQNPLVQTHPAVFNDKSTADELIASVKEGKYKGVVWDIFHALEQTSDGARPLGENWERSLRKLLEAGVLKEVHISPGRIVKRYGFPEKDFDWIRGMVGNPNYRTTLGKTIRIIKESQQKIPFVVEIPAVSWVRAGILPKKFLFSTGQEFMSINRQVIDYIKRV